MYVARREWTGAVSERAPQAQVARRKRVRFPEGAHRNVVRRPLADPRNRDEPRDRVVEIERRIESQRSVDDGGSERANRRRTRARDADPPEIGVGEHVRRRKEMREAGARRRDRRPERAGEPPRERRRAGDRDLLAEHGAHRELESVPRARHAHAGTRVDGGTQLGAPSQLTGDTQRIGGEVEETPRALDDLNEIVVIGEPDLHDHVPLRGDVAHLDLTVRLGSADRAPVDVAIDGLDARRRAPREKAQQSLPVERRAIRQTHDEALARRRIRGRPAAQAARA